MKCPNCKKNIDYFNQLKLGNKLSSCEHCGIGIKENWMQRFFKAFIPAIIFIFIAGIFIDNEIAIGVIAIIACFITLKYVFVLEKDDNDSDTKDKS